MGRSRLRVRDGVRALHPAVRASRDLDARPCCRPLRARRGRGQWRSRSCHGRAGPARHGDRRIGAHGRTHRWRGQPSVVLRSRREPWTGRRCSSKTQPSMPPLSVLGIILFPDAERGLAEMRRVVRPGGRVSVVTWTQPQNYELAAELRAAILSVWPDQPQAPLPAQLRYREETDFKALFQAAGLGDPVIAIATAHLEAPSARWLSERIGFAPGMAAMMAGLGHRATRRHASVRREPRDAIGPGADQPLRRGIHRLRPGSVTFSPASAKNYAGVSRLRRLV